MPEPSVPILLAHTGHWIEWVLYAVPVVAVLVAIVVSGRRARALDEGESDDSP